MGTKSTRCAASLALLFVLAWNCPAQDSGTIFPAVVATVNGDPVLGKELEALVRRELSTIGNPEWKKLRGEYRSELVLGNMTALINSRLLYQKAAAAGVKVADEELRAELKKIAATYKSEKEMNEALARENTDRATFEKNVYRNLAASKYLEDAVNKKVAVSPEEIASYYSSRPEEFRHPDIVRTSQILISFSENDHDAAAGRARDLLERLRKGEDFAALAREHSADSSSAARGGDVGFASADGLPPEYSAAAFSLPVGELALVKTQHSYHIIKVTGKKEEGTFTFEEIRPELHELLRARKYQEKLKEVIDQLRETAEIEILISASELLNP